MRNATIKGVIIFGALTILGIIAIQTYLVRRTWHLEQAKFQEKVRIALISTAENLASLNNYPLPSQNLVREVEPNYFIVNINNIINANNLEYYLQQALEAVALTEDFEYGIYDCASQDMLYGQYISYSKADESARRTDLPTYDEFEYYFGVRFPNRESYLLGNLQLTFILTAILALTIAFFAWSIFVILRQKQLSEMQKDFINNMTHEFKTPISTIGISADVFLGHPSVRADDRLMRYAGIISEQNNRLNRQVEKVLQLARIEQGNFSLNPEPVNLRDLLEPVIQSAEVKINDTGGRFTLDLQAPEGTTIQADRLHLTNMLHNLLDNAIKYCRETPDVTLRTALSPADQTLLISIIDRGIGIPKDHQSRVFQKFYRVPTGNVHNVKGFGLGLYYIRTICLAHGWRIRLESEEAHGTTVTLEVPLPPQ